MSICKIQYDQLLMELIQDRKSQKYIKVEGYYCSYLIIDHFTMQTFLDAFQTCVEADAHDFHRLS